MQRSPKKSSAGPKNGASGGDNPRLLAVEKVEARIADAVKKRAQGGDRWQPPRWPALMRADG
jgi:hypothetical protein